MPPAIKDDGLFCLRLLGAELVLFCHQALFIALDLDVQPVERALHVRHAFDQLLALLDQDGLARVNGFIALPLPSQSTTTRETRLEAGNQTQVDIFGEGMRGFQDSGPEESRHINRWLADNCFGDYYTRTGLDNRQREMITFCFLAGQGGCEPQLTSHAAGNMRVGNSKEFLIQIISQCLPYLGYPRSLNALRCVNEAAAK